MKWIGWSALLFGAVGCLAETGPEPSSTGGRVEWIVDGTRETGEEAVVLVTTTRGLCSGTLIAPRVVLTAKHCVQESGAETPYRAGQFSIGIGSSIRGLSRQYRVAQVDTTPGVWSTGSRGLSGAIVGIDIGLLTLTEPVDASVIPYRVDFANPGGQIGQTQKAIGFGQTPAGEVGIKYRTTTTVRAVMGNVIYTGPAICEGDSGGPLIRADTNELIGVASFGTGECGSGYAGYNRVDADAMFTGADGARTSLAALIQGVVEASGSCVGMTTEICNGSDDDCNGMVDEVCIPLGDPCAADDRCVGTFCDMTSVGRICTAECDPLQPAIGCGTGLYCSRSSGCEGRCVPIPSGAEMLMLPVGTDCNEDVECASWLCADPGDGRRRCLTPCRADAGMCFSGEACPVPAGGCSGCVDAEIVRGTRGLGEPCTADEDCGSRSCLDDSGRMYCTRECTDDAGCGTGFHCRDGSCIRGQREGLGGPCLANADCEEHLFCAARGETTWCTRFCPPTSGEMCDEGFECVAVGDVSICVPELSLVGDTCVVNEDCLSTLCAIMGERSVCTRACSPEAPCGTGFDCVRAVDGSAVCIEALEAPPPPKDDGCGCRTPGGTGRSTAAMASGMLWVVAAVSRRRGSRARGTGRS